MTVPVKTKTSHQLMFPALGNFQPAVDLLAKASIEERGAIFTRLEVVEFILDLVGYTTDTPLFTQRLLEPSFGNGDFLLVVAERLLTAYRRVQPLATHPVRDLKDCLRAVELHTASFQSTRQKLAAPLLQNGLTSADAEELLDPLY